MTGYKHILDFNVEFLHALLPSNTKVIVAVLRASSAYFTEIGMQFYFLFYI